MDIRNTLITHHMTVMAVDLENKSISHVFMREVNASLSPIYISKKKDKYILKTKNNLYIKDIIGNKIVTVAHESYFDNIINLDNNTVSICVNDKYLSARKNGTFNYVNENKQWEEFIFFESNDGE